MRMGAVFEWKCRYLIKKEVGSMRCNRSVWIWVFPVAILSMCNGHIAAQTFIEFNAHRSSTSVPFKLIDGRIFVDVRVNGEGPFAFIFDTGGNAIISSKVAGRLHLAAGN